MEHRARPDFSHVPRAKARTGTLSDGRTDCAPVSGADLGGRHHGSTDHRDAGDGRDHVLSTWSDRRRTRRAGQPRAVEVSDGALECPMKTQRDSYGWTL